MKKVNILQFSDLLFFLAHNPAKRQPSNMSDAATAVVSHELI